MSLQPSTPQHFAEKWRQLAGRLTERAAYQEHWRDLCDLLGEPTPTQDLTGQDYAFEKHVKKAGTGETGYADVFRRDHFIVEYKSRGKSLGKALQQALLYARELGNPPLLVVSDLEGLEIHTNFTGSSPRTIRMGLDDIARDAPVGGDLTALSALRAMFHDPEKLHPGRVRERVTQEATANAGSVAQSLVARGVPQDQAAHFLMRAVFAMFAEDVGLLEQGLLTRLLDAARLYPAESRRLFGDLFGAMRTGGFFGSTHIRHFNGGLFDDSAALELVPAEIEALLTAARLDWSEVEPAIFGTLFENSLDAETRSRRGAHYTSVTDILRITEPVIMQPLRREWTQVKEEAEALAKKKRGKQGSIALLQFFHKQLGETKVLDPACGSGNFLVVALRQLLDLEEEVRALGSELGAGPVAMPPRVHPQQMLGLEVEPLAQELASVAIWIAYIQWKAVHGGDWPTPVLQTLRNVENRDALLNPDGTEAAWPAADFIVGNPPFLGDKVMRGRLGDEYTDRLRAVYGQRLPGQSDLVCYWPEKARAAIEAGTARRAGFVTTNSIRGGKNRVVLERIKASGDLFMAWADEPWQQDGAAVRVSLFGFDGGDEELRMLNDQHVAVINADFTSGSDVTVAEPLAENVGLSFIGTQKGGAFDIPEEVALAWLDLPNPSGISNREVVKPWVNGMDITRRPSRRWIIDFNQMDKLVAAAYLLPFEYVQQTIEPERARSRDRLSKVNWWLHQRSRPDMRLGLTGLERYLVTPRVAKHRLWVFVPSNTVPDSRLVVITREDDVTFGILSSSLHAMWSLAQGGWHGVGNDPQYNAVSCFETFPFPHPTDDQRTEIEKWAQYIVQMREHLLAQSEKATLTGLYNDVERLRQTPDATHPVTALASAHAKLDAAVAAAYGWEWPLLEDEVLSRLLALNLERAGQQG